MLTAQHVKICNNIVQNPKVFSKNAVYTNIGTVVCPVLHVFSGIRKAISVRSQDRQ